MKNLTLIAMSVASTILILLASPPPAAACEFDLLAMCCWKTNSRGNCTQWKNCCSIQAPGNDSESSGTHPAFVAERPCVEKCNRRARGEGGRSSCYSSCATKQPKPTRIARFTPAGGGDTGDFKLAKKPSGNHPTLSQVGSNKAKVPMKHGGCGLDCNTHVLAVANGNLDMKLQVGMTCPAGTKVDHLSFKPQGQNATTVISSPATTSVNTAVFAQPFSKRELEDACEAALGGSWAVPGHHDNSSATVVTDLEKTVQVWGHCTGWANKTKRNYEVDLEVTCVDQSRRPSIP